MALTLRASHSHLFPGARGTIVGALPQPGASVDTAVEFADGAQALAELAGGEDGRQVLIVGPYITARGTAIDEKRWALAIETKTGGEARFRVAARIAE